MTYQEQVCQWEQTVSSHLPQLSTPQVRVLACWSFALVLLKSVGMTQVSVCLALMLGGKVGAWRQKLREWCYEAADKKGEQRAQLEVAMCFAPLLAWMVSWWQAREPQLVLVVDASARGAHLTLLSVSVVYRRGAMAVAWHLLPTGAAGAWEPMWEQMLAQLAPAIPAQWQVLVMADRGLYSRHLSEAIRKLGWHPFLRLNLQGTAKQAGRDDYQPLRSFIPADGTVWSGRGSCFQSERRLSETTRLSVHVPGYPDSWVVVTDLEPQQSLLAWYAMRLWIEVGFKQGKRGGWQWQHSKMTDPRRVERYCLVMAVATLDTVSQGEFGEAELADSHLEALPPTHIARRQAKGRPRRALLSQFTLGRLWLMRTIVEQEPLQVGSFAPSRFPAGLAHLPASSSSAQATEEEPGATPTLATAASRPPEAGRSKEGEEKPTRVKTEPLDRLGGQPQIGRLYCAHPQYRRHWWSG